MKQKDRQNRGSKVAREKKIKKIIVIGLIVAVAIGIGIAVASSKFVSSSNASAMTIDGIQCDAAEQLVFHNHAHLDIYINGQPYTVPSQIGIIPGKCIYWLHTHDGSGIIHIESPVTRNFTLGQFFDIWKTKSNNAQAFNNIFKKTGNDNMPQIYKNGNKLPSNTNYKDIKLDQHDEIVLVYGTPSTNKPSKYDFPRGS